MFLQQSIRLLNYVSLSTITFLVYDWLLTFGDEVTYIWNTVWSLPKALYIVSRYYPILHLSIISYVRNLTDTSSKLCVLFWPVVYSLIYFNARCYSYTWYQGFGGVLCVIPPVTTIFTLRVWALYKNTRSSRYIFLFVWFLWFSEAVGVLVTTIRVTIGEHRDTIGYRPGCLTVTKSNPHLYRSELLAWIPALFGSFMLFLLTLYRLGYLFPLYIFNFNEEEEIQAGSQTRLLLTFVKDGTIYFFLVFAATTLTMVSDLAPKLSLFNDLWHPWYIMLYSLSGSRLIINLRRNAHIDEQFTTPSTEEQC